MTMFDRLNFEVGMTVIMFLMVISIYSCGLTKVSNGVYTTNPAEYENKVLINNKSFECEKFHPKLAKGISRHEIVAEANVRWAGMPPSDDQVIYTFPKESPMLGAHPLTPVDGDYYLGLKVSRDGTRGRVARSLSQPLVPSNIYKIDLSVASVDYLVELDSNNRESILRPEPGGLRLWGAFDCCEEQDLLFESELVTPKSWSRMTMEFTPPVETSFIIIEVYGESKDVESMILMDDMSNIEIIN